MDEPFLLRYLPYDGMAMAMIAIAIAMAMARYVSTTATGDIAGDCACRVGRFSLTLTRVSVE